MEVVIYIALFGILMSGAVVATYQLLTGGESNQAAVLVQEEGTFLYRKVNWALSGATAVSTTTNALIITRPDLGLQSPITFTFDPIHATLSIARGTGSPNILNSAAYAVTDVLFQTSFDPVASSTRVEFDFSVHGVPFSFLSYLRQ